MLPHQQRVIDEKNELDIKTNALSEFIGENPIFKTLDDAERTRLRKQLGFMQGYSSMLGERIAAFSN
jgi:hypothetical protein